MTDLIPLDKAEKEGILPVPRTTLYRWRNSGRYPGVTVRIGKKLFWNSKKWAEIVAEETQKEHERKNN